MWHLTFNFSFSLSYRDFCFWTNYTRKKFQTHNKRLTVYIMTVIFNKALIYTLFYRQCYMYSKGIAFFWNRIHYCLKCFNYLNSSSNLWFAYFNILHLCICDITNGDRQSHNILQQKRKWFVNLFEVLKFIRQNILRQVMKHNSYSQVYKTSTHTYTHGYVYILTKILSFTMYDEMIRLMA